MVALSAAGESEYWEEFDVVWREEELGEAVLYLFYSSLFDVRNNEE
jgi:hypothetical protein